MSLNAIECHDIEEHTKALADYMPGGKLWAAKNIANSNLRNFIKGVSGESVRAETFLKALQDQYIPDNTQNFLDDWEGALGIPDDCFDGEGDNDERRRDILVKLASLGVQTVADFQNLASLFGITATVLPGEEATPVPPNPKFTIVIEFVAPEGFPFTFPITFGSDTINILECLFNRLKPANCATVFTQVSPP